MRTSALALLLAWSAAAAEPVPTPPPPDAACNTLPDARAVRPSFRSGEVLEFTLDALGAQAGKMTLRVLPVKGGRISLEARAATNAWFSRIRRVSGRATSEVDPFAVRPRAYHEESEENGVHRTAEVQFEPDSHGVRVRYTIGDKPGEAEFRYAHDGLDGISTVYALRQVPFREGMPLCMDVYGLRHLWRLSGKILQREHLSLGLGEYEAWHIIGEAVRLDDFKQRREVHMWLSDDARRLPLVAMGVLDVGLVRATLVAYRRPGEKPVRAESAADLKW